MNMVDTHPNILIIILNVCALIALIKRQIIRMEQKTRLNYMLFTKYFKYETHNN